MICNYDHLKAPILELSPAAAHVCCVLPDHLGVVADAPAAMLSRPEPINTLIKSKSKHCSFSVT